MTSLNRRSFTRAAVDPVRARGTHALRHLYASVLLDAGENIKARSEYLGHAGPGFTLRVYTHLMPSSSERTRRAVDDALGAAEIQQKCSTTPKTGEK